MVYHILLSRHPVERFSYTTVNGALGAPLVALARSGQLRSM
jgi:hypothetical protein